MAEDRIGLLYSLATVFSSNACNIDTVLIDTKGHRASTFFTSPRTAASCRRIQETLKHQLLRPVWASEGGRLQYHCGPREPKEYLVTVHRRPCLTAWVRLHLACRIAKMIKPKTTIGISAIAA